MSKSKYNSLRSFASYLSSYKLRLGITALSFLASDFLLVIIPVFIGRLVGTLAESSVDSHQAYTYVVILIVCSTGHDLLWRLSEALYLKLLLSVSFTYETLAFKHVIQKPYPYFVDKFTGKIASYVTALGKEFRELMDNIFWSYLNAGISLIAVSAILIHVDWRTGATFVVGLLLMFLVGRRTIGKSAKYEKLAADTQSTKNAKIIDAIGNFVNIKSFQKESKEITSIEAEQAINIAAAKRSFLWSMFFWGSMSVFVRQLIWPATILFNVYLFIEGEISLAALTTFLSTILLFSNFIWEIIWYVSQFNLKLARIEESHKYLFGDVNIIKQRKAEKAYQSDPKPFNQVLEFKKLHFAYPDKDERAVLQNISLGIRKGEKVGVVGRSGSGKTTLTKLLLGYYPVKAGQLVLDGKPIDNRDLSQLISYVPQDTSLFHRSVAENISYATDRNVTQDEVEYAAKQAHAHEFISQITDGYEALVGERGVKLSAGQRQRIAIARAFLDDKPILILDEATSALDSESEVLVQDALEALWENKTVIAIAHRLSTLRNMDTIIVIDKGKVIEKGSHEELLNKGGSYAKLWDHQSGGFMNDEDE